MNMESVQERLSEKLNILKNILHVSKIRSYYVRERKAWVLVQK